MNLIFRIFVTFQIQAAYIFSNEICELTCADTYKMIGMHYALPGLVYAVHTMHK